MLTKIVFNPKVFLEKDSKLGINSGTYQILVAAHGSLPRNKPRASGAGQYLRPRRLEAVTQTTG